MAGDLATNFDTCAAYDNVGDEMLGAVEINSDTQLHADADISARRDRLWPYGIVQISKALKDAARNSKLDLPCHHEIANCPPGPRAHFGYTLQSADCAPSTPAFEKLRLGDSAS